MKRLPLAPRSILWVAMAAALLALPVVSQMTRPKPLVLPLACPAGDCPLLTGTPQTAGMRSGFVRLKPGETVGWHTTGQNEETLVILRGQGAALIEGQPARAFAAPTIAYIPPTTRHDVANTGTELLEYVYVVAPARLP
jgi:mannose-6-phosphate isomerase-like protein (cupin superfamily)